MYSKEDGTPAARFKIKFMEIQRKVDIIKLMNLQKEISEKKMEK